MDPEIMTLAFSGSQKMAEHTLLKLHVRGEDSKVKEHLAYLRRQLAPFETFSRCILGNMLSYQTTQATGTHLTLLNQGFETSITYKKSLADFLGIPTGTWLKHLQQAERNALEAIEPWAHELQ